jgi:hypothetical protein
MRTRSNVLQEQELLKRNPDLLEFINALKYEFQEWQRPPDQQVIDDVDLQKLLKVSKRTTANYRAQGLICYRLIGGKIFYLYSEVLEALEKNKIPALYERVRVGKK